LLRYRYRCKKLHRLHCYRYQGIRNESVISIIVRVLLSLCDWNGTKIVRYKGHDYKKTVNIPLLPKRLRVFSPTVDFFGQNSRKSVKQLATLAPIFCPLLISRQTKCNDYIVTFSNGLSRIVTSYLGIKCANPSRYSLHRYSFFKNMIGTIE
jgi:hypothetical protein